MKHAVIAMALSVGQAFADTPIESDPAYNAARDPCYELKSRLRQLSGRLQAHTEEAKRDMVMYLHLAKSNERAQTAAFDGLWSAAGDIYQVAKCASDPSAVPANAVRLSRAALTVGLIVLPGVSPVGDAMARNAWRSYGYNIGQIKEISSQIAATEEALRKCCSPYLKPPADPTPPPPNPAGGGGPVTNPGSGTTNPPPGGTAGQGTGPESKTYFQVAGPELIPEGDPTGGPPGGNPRFGFYGRHGYVPVSTELVLGLGRDRLRTALRNSEALRRHCEEAVQRERAEMASNATQARPFGDLYLSKCFRDASYSADYILYEVNLRQSRGHSAPEIRLILELQPDAIAIRDRAVAARAQFEQSRATR